MAEGRMSTAIVGGSDNDSAEVHRDHVAEAVRSVAVNRHHVLASGRGGISQNVIGVDQ